VQGGASFLSQNDPRLHFGLGADAAYARMEVRWPTGEIERFPGGAANRIVVLTQGSGTRTDARADAVRRAARAWLPQAWGPRAGAAPHVTPW
jgi:hypothetical protein